MYSAHKLRWGRSSCPVCRSRGTWRGISFLLIRVNEVEWKVSRAHQTVMDLECMEEVELYLVNYDLVDFSWYPSLTPNQNARHTGLRRERRDP